jgi:hypothetical protein
VPNADPHLNGHVDSPAFTDRGILNGGWEPNTKPDIQLPQEQQQHLDTALQLALLMHEARGWVDRGGVVARLSHRPFGVRTITGSEAVTDLESGAFFFRYKRLKSGHKKKVYTPITATTANIILNAEVTRTSLPSVRVLSKCPVLVERDDHLVGIVGFDRESGIYVHPDAKMPENVPIGRVMDYFNNILRDFEYATDGDKSRMVAAILTPALVRSGLFGESARGGPINFFEADQSQTGKGLSEDSIAAIYNDVPCIITQLEGGVGGLDESLQSAYIAGHSFICIDNLTGRFRSPFMEAAMTGKAVSCRAPYREAVLVDPRPTSLGITSNGGDVSRDTINRSNFIRLKKRPDGYQFHAWPEGGLLEHVRENQRWLLGCVWACLREWHARGCPLADDDGQHDFRQWARCVRYICMTILGIADPLDGYREIQESKAVPALAWLRQLLLAVVRARKTGNELRAHDLLNLCVEVEVEVPGMTTDEAKQEARRDVALRSLGRRLAVVFASKPVVTVDGTTVQRIERQGSNGKPDKSYVFGTPPGMLIEEVLPV